MNTVDERIIKEKNRVYKKKENLLLLIVFIVGIACYLFFLTSGMWLSAEKENVKATKMFTELEVNNRTITPIKWCYSEEDKEMEAIIEIKKTGIDKVDEYDFSVVSKKGVLKADKIKRINNNFVIRFTDVNSGWSQISLRINKKGSGNEEFQTVKLYALEKSIERSEHIKERGAKGYLIEIAECKISHLRRSMKNIEKVIKEGDRLIKEGEKTQKRLSENMQYQTETSKKKIEENMSKVDSEIKKEKAKILEEQEKVNEIKTEIELQKAWINSLKEKGTKE